MILLRLTQSFYGREDTRLTAKLLTERPGILLWAIEGWRRLHERGYFVQPDSGTDLREQMEDIASPISAFVRERCSVAAGQCVSVASLFGEWKLWCETSNREPGSEQIFGRDLLAAFPQLGRKRRQEGDSRWREYEGINVNS